jgi:hypothetical protein
VALSHHPPVNLLSLSPREGLRCNESIELAPCWRNNLASGAAKIRVRASARAAAALLPYLFSAWLSGREGAGSVQVAAPAADVFEAIGLEELGCIAAFLWKLILLPASLRDLYVYGVLKKTQDQLIAGGIDQDQLDTAGFRRIARVRRRSSRPVPRGPLRCRRWLRAALC